MGKVSNRSTLVSSRCRILKDEDSGFGGDNSLDLSQDSESCTHNTSSGTTSTTTLPSLASSVPSFGMVPQAKVFLVSLLQGGVGGVGGSSMGPALSSDSVSGLVSPVTQEGPSTQSPSIVQAQLSSDVASPREHLPHQSTTTSSTSTTTSCSAPVQEALLSATSLKAEPSSPALGHADLSCQMQSSTSSSNCSGWGPKGFGHVGASGKAHQDIFVQNGPKRIRIDVSEEAQELPELPKTLPKVGSQQRCHLTRSSSASSTPPALISFTNVPALLSASSSGLHSITPTPCNGQVVCMSKQSAPTRVSKISRNNASSRVPSLTSSLSPHSSDGKVELVLLAQPECQHRARYQTEGSRGAVKDRSGQGHPMVKLVGYNKPATIQVFIGSDSGKIVPHMFYQACRVSGKNSMPCKEKRTDGTVVIEIIALPEQDMTISCDCVGILKERNVDVEHRFKAVVSRARKKSTKCRMVFRTSITLANGTQETLQIVSEPISCTQPPGIPEICRKSLSNCLVTGGMEMFIIGKNFLKDTVVCFQQLSTKDQPIWEESVTPDKEYLQPTHLICEVPKYFDLNIEEEVSIQVVVKSCGKVSEPQNFVYQPIVKPDKSQGTLFQKQPLPKGVSPVALEMSQQFAETGSVVGLMTPSKDSNLQQQHQQPVSPLPRTATDEKPLLVREQAVVHPMRGRLLATVAPGVRSIQPSAPYQSSPETRTVTVSSANTPVPAASQVASETSIDLPQENTMLPGLVPISGEQKTGTQEGVTNNTHNLENLVKMLQLARSFPNGSSSLQMTLVPIIADEIIKQVKKEKGTAKEKQDTIQDNKILLNNDSATSKWCRLLSVVGGNKQVPAASTPASTAVTVSLERPVVASVANPSSNSISMSLKREVVNTSDIECTKVIKSDDYFEKDVPAFEVDCASTDFCTNDNTPFAEEVPLANFPTTLIPPVSHTNGGQVLLLTNVIQGQGEKRNGDSVILNSMVRGESSSNVEVNSVLQAATQMQMSPTLTSHIPISDIPLVQQQIDTQTSFIGSKRVQIPQISRSSQSQVDITTGINPPSSESQSHTLNQTLNSVSLPDPLFAQNGTQVTQTISQAHREPESESVVMHMDLDSSSVPLTLTNSDPLLSQVSPISNLKLHNDPTAVSITTISGASPVTSSQQRSVTTEEICTPQQVIPVSSQNEVTSAISQLSENELLNLINPNCFDNV
ncbi:uncharacterized protein LOC143036737 isoform X2 [Oratosquilla oratoria]|uniref:uncharacterized protein LOC143036737 isoform X2 n=1 Tax=Oratosquilla oratoria TaxID=337810 RepID=UPI003F75B020